MFSSLRVILLALSATVLLVGGVIASTVINATSPPAAPIATSAAALAAATRSLPADWLVGPGDTFTSVAARNHLSVDQLAQLNPSQDPASLVPGQRLQLHVHTPPPPAARHAVPHHWTIRTGDTLTSIAAATGVQIGEIAQLNPNVNPAALVPGRRLKLRP